MHPIRRCRIALSFAFFQSPIHRGRGCIQIHFFEYSFGRNLSVPYSSGPWLHHHQWRRGPRLRFPFSPLFIGAVVASNYFGPDEVFATVFQSPIHRGRGCILLEDVRVLKVPVTFSPLFIGAVVASPGMVARTKGSWSNFQSPIHRGRGCIEMSTIGERVDKELSVPYSSGPWLHRPPDLPFDPDTRSLSVPYSSGPWLHPNRV